jgi:hypothetical protein
MRSSEIEYWLVPYRLVGKALAKATVKKSDDSSFIRILRSGEQFTINGVDVTDCYHSLSLSPEEARKFKKISSRNGHDRSGVKVTISIDGHRYSGVVQELNPC